MILVLDKAGKVVAALKNQGSDSCPYYDDIHYEKLRDTKITYSFNSPANREEAGFLIVGNSIARKDLDGNLILFKIVQTTDDTVGGQKVKKVYAVNSGLELRGAIVRPTTLTAYSLDQALDHILTNTRWNRGITTWRGVNTVSIENYEKVSSLLLQLMELYDVEIRFRVEIDGGRITGRYVDMLERRGMDTGKRIEYAKDIQGLTREEDIQEVATALIGLGKTDSDGNRTTIREASWSVENGDPANKPIGDDYLGDPNALAIWGEDGYHLFDVFEDNEEDNPQRLLQKTYDELMKRTAARMTYVVDAVVLDRVAGLEHEKVRLGDKIIVKDTSFEPALIIEARVVEIERSYSDPTRDKIVLGDYRRLLDNQSDILKSLQDKLSSNEEAWTANSRIVQSDREPTNKKNYWLDTSVVPNVLKRWDEALQSWIKATPTDALEVGAERELVRSSTEPEDKEKIWFDTSQIPNVVKRYDFTSNEWVKASPTEAAEIGAETPQGAQSKAAEAESNAKSHADSNDTNLRNDLSTGAQEVAAAALQGEIDVATNTIKKDSYFYWDETGFYAIDPSNTNNVVRLTSGGLGVSTDGGSIFQTAITGEGVVADLITAGTLRGIDIYGVNIEGSLITSTGESGYVKLEGDRIVSYNEARNETSEISEGQLLVYDDVPSKIGEDGPGNRTEQLEIQSNGIYWTTFDNTSGGWSIFGRHDDRAWMFADAGWQINGGGNGVLIEDMELLFADGPKINTNQGHARWQANNYNYIYQSSATSGDRRGYVSFYQNGELSFQFFTKFNDNKHRAIKMGRIHIVGLNGSTMAAQIRNESDSGYAPIYASEFIPASDREFKEDITDYDKEGILEEFRNVKPKRYRLSTDPTREEQIGLIAQEAPAEIVRDMGDGKGISIYAMSTYLWKVVQELADEIDRLKNGTQS